MHSFCVAWDANYQPSSDRLPIVDTSFDIFVNLDGRISSPLAGMWSKKVSKHLPCLGIRCRQYNCVEVEEVA